MDRQTKTVFTFLEEFKTLKPGFLLLGAAAAQLLRFGEIRSYRSSFTVWRALRDAQYYNIAFKPIRTQYGGHMTSILTNGRGENAKTWLYTAQFHRAPLHH